MTEEIIMLMERLIDFHDLYESDYESFRSRFDLEITYCYHLKKLNKLIDKQFETIKPFSNQ